MLTGHIGLRRVTFQILAAVSAIALSGASMAASEGERSPSDRVEHVLDTYASLPLAFVENRGQFDSPARYYIRGPRYAFYLTADEVLMSFLNGGETAGHALALRFPGSNRGRQLSGEERAPGIVSYFHGSDPDGWRTEIPRFSEVGYRELWAGVDLRLSEQRGTLKYEFRVAPGANPSSIRLAYSGATGLSIDASGALSIDTSLGTLHDAKPVSYQVIDGKRVPVDSRYVLRGGTDDAAEYGFAIENGYRSDRELIIDPGIAYSTFLGGSSHELGNGIQVDGAGNAYIVGTTQSPDFPTRPGAFKRTGAPSNVSEVFVSKLNPTGTALVYSTFLGGSNFDFGRAIAIDAAGNAWITGITGSTDFPVTPDGFDLTFNAVADAFVAELSADGSSLLYATYLGGAQSEGGDDLSLGADGDVYVTGHTYSLDFPTTAGALDIVFNGDTSIFWGDAFVTRIATDTGASAPPSTPPVPPAATLLSPANGDTPSQPITFDWSDVPGAASYMIEVDDVSGFTAPLVRDVNVTSSQYVTSGLTTTLQFWRVRAVNAAGVAGRGR